MKRPKPSYPLLIMVVFGVGLLLAGTLLYRWVNRVSVADREHQVEFLDAAMRSFRGDFAGTLLEIRSTFRPIPRSATPEALDEYLAEFYSQWRANDPNAPLVATLSVVTLKNDELQFRTLNVRSSEFKSQPWPASLERLQVRMARIAARRHQGRVFPFFPDALHFAVEGEQPVVVVPLVVAGGDAMPADGWMSLEEPGHRHWAPGGSSEALCGAISRGTLQGGACWGSTFPIFKGKCFRTCSNGPSAARGLRITTSLL